MLINPAILNISNLYNRSTNDEIFETIENKYCNVSSIYSKRTMENLIV